MGSNCCKTKTFDNNKVKRCTSKLVSNTIIAPTFYDVKNAAKKLKAANRCTSIEDLRKEF